MRLTDLYGSLRLEDLDPTGLPDLQQALSDFSGVRPEKVAVTCGGMMALTCVLKALRLRSQADALLCPLPHFPAYPGLAQLEGFRPEFYPLDPRRGWQPDVAKLERQIIALRPAAVIVNSPHNPTGAVLPAAALARVQAATEKAGAWLVVDEAFSGLSFDAAEPPPPSGEHVVRVGSLNKRFPRLADVRAGYMIAESDVLRDAALLHRTLAVGASLRDQRLAATALRDRPREQLARLRAELREQRDEACAVLRASGRFRLHPPAAGLFLWLRLPDGWEPFAFRDAVKAAHGFWCAAGPRFGWTEWPCVRLRFGVPRRILLRQCRELAAFADRWSPPGMEPSDSFRNERHPRPATSDHPA